MPELETPDVMERFRESLEKFVSSAGDDADTVRRDLQSLYAEIEPLLSALIDEAVLGVECSEDGIESLRAALISRTGYGSEWIAQRREELNALIIGFVRGAIAVGIALV